MGYIVLLGLGGILFAKHKGLTQQQSTRIGGSCTDRTWGIDGVKYSLNLQKASYEDAIELIRSKRKGAINAKQLKYLKDYKPKKTKCCIIV